MTTPSTEREIRRRRRYTREFKASVIAACQQPDVSIAQVALAYGLNTNLVQKWIRLAKKQSHLPAPPDFVPLPVPTTTPERPSAQPSSSDITIEIPNARGAITVRWPVSDAAQCVQWLKGLL
nr:transposase [Halomonas socia]